MRPGACRTNSCRVAKNAACGPPKPSGTPKRCELPTTTSAPQLAGRRQQRERQQVGRRRRRAPWRRAPLAMSGPMSTTRAVVVRVLQERAEHVRGVDGQLSGGADLQPDPERFGAALQHRQRLREHAIRHQEHPAVGRLLRRDAVQQRHRLAGRGGFVEQRRVGHRQPGEVGDHRLEVQERLEAALRDLGLVRRVGRVPARVLEQAPADHARRDGVVVAQADEAAQHLVALGDGRRAGSGTRTRIRRRAAPPASAGGWRREWLRR